MQEKGRLASEYQSPSQRVRLGANCNTHLGFSWGQLHLLTYSLRGLFGEQLQHSLTWGFGWGAIASLTCGWVGPIATLTWGRKWIKMGESG